ncbi:hypothetical protein HPG69_003830 [Diceros bicornis minor]|uniref:Uncharacterized protein n=1 Tax=Diceros bicornis minor TaxID=77932 RepID=A0A7J7ETR7_DICBM|nr:hypothetical protein HPG69_003830 [Diceros bicornis minor]
MVQQENLYATVNLMTANRRKEMLLKNQDALPACHRQAVEN